MSVDYPVVGRSRMGIGEIQRDGRVLKFGGFVEVWDCWLIGEGKGTGRVWVMGT